MNNEVVELVVTLLSAGVMGALLNHAAQSRRDDRKREHAASLERSARLAAVSASGWDLTIVIGDLARVEHSQKDEVERSESFERCNSRFHEAMSRVQIDEDQSIVAAAFNYYAALYRLNRLARSNVWDRTAFSAQRGGLDQAVNDYIAACRRALERDQVELELPGAARDEAAETDDAGH